MTSGQWAETRPLFIDSESHYRDDRIDDELCPFEGTVDATYDPERADDRVWATCPDCQAELEIRI